jgi:Ni,Fe-hydrogenase I large subunit
MAQKIIIDPVNRQEGHLCIDVNMGGLDASKGQKVTKSLIHGQLFRGFEQIMIGRHPSDAMVITPRI